MRWMQIKDVVVYGTGAIGSVLATFLQLSNENNERNIHLVGREHILHKIKENGLEYLPFDELSEPIITKGFEYHTHIKDVSRADVIFLSVKVHGLEQALEDAHHLLEQNPYVFLTMNGLGLVDIVKKYIPEQYIIECTVNYPSHLHGNTVKNSGGNSNILVKLTEEPPIRIIVNKLFIPDTLDIRVIDDFTLSQWKKGIMNIGMNALSAITMSTVGQVLEKKTLGKIIKELIKEAVIIAEKEGVTLDVNMVEYFWQFAGRDPDHTTSTYQDILHDKPTEVEFFNGFIVKKGKQYNIPTPANEAIFSLIKIIEGKI